MPDASHFHLVVHGCRVNQYEAQALREAWETAGALGVEDPAAADVVVVLTCAVTARAVQSLRRELPRLRRSAPAARHLCAGCVPQAIPGELKAAAEGWELWGKDRKADLLHLFDALPAASTDPSWPPFAVTGSERARALCKIQDGCSQACAFCIIPKARGGPVSRPEAETLAEIRRLFAAGAREVVLSGINLGQYTGESGNLWALLRRIQAELAPEWAGRGRIRLSSLDPGLLTPAGLEALAECSMLCPHLHLSLQSGSAAVLHAMGRRQYRIEDAIRWVEDARRILPVLGLGADLLTGFPGEDDDAFAETESLFHRLPLTYAHVFPFSPRPGTRAAHLPGQVPVSRRLGRAQTLRDLALQRAREFAAVLLNQPVLFMVVEQQGMDSMAGICEYGVRCRHLLRPDDHGRFARREMTPVHPRALDEDGDGLLVVATAGPSPLPFTPHPL
ncbi:MiaB/RimO family radical SAM methylthiotransferase [Megalodesulfovibrio gigas]|uniref:Putative RNA modification enzyme, MiaB family protein n=1 Tax=Megalodesulfovibrio gigas (strain ATCC 19364 / DSM 1382 / NCIMB 9332 / VKM B-1759) TaxID=1121448 RepID=T2GG17_MEGG1|nr:MiaB/RimO family radical SAM methylthiotransferase [Megalodesulfovibrio gigas]AGW14917.1 putative RNA modification enzyme, MiaB family protein [Megalodesulfovibrio gigas DSM 1382 = ATCC 19364]